MADDYDFITPRRDHFLRTADGEEILLVFKKRQAPGRVRSGQRAKVRATRLPGRGKLKRYTVDTIELEDNGPERRRRTFFPGGIQDMTVGSRDAILMLLQFPDGHQWTTGEQGEAVDGLFTA